MTDTTTKKPRLSAKNYAAVEAAFRKHMMTAPAAPTQKPLALAPVATPAPAPAPATAAPPAPIASVVIPTVNAPASVDPLLVSILSWRRKHDSPSEKAFCSWLFAQIKVLNDKALVSRMSTLDNVVAVVPTVDGKESDVMFSAHVDTQDHSKGNFAACPPAGIKQPLVYDANFGHIMVDTKAPDAGGCLGADDGIGVWIMLRMIEKGVPGTYVFHRGEEVGGLGASAMLAGHKDFLKKFNMAVAFDRPGTDEVILTQGGSRCASDKFGNALAKALTMASDQLMYRISHAGVFTDTKVYRGVIAECVNIGVGYEGQHSTREVQDYTHAVALLDACLALDWSSLPIDRDPATAANEYNGSRRGMYAGGYWGDDDDGYDANGGTYYRAPGGGWEFRKPSTPAPAPKSTAKAPAPKPMSPAKQLKLSWRDELEGSTYDDLLAAAQENPAGVVELLMDLMANLSAAEAKTETYRGLLGLQ